MNVLDYANAKPFEKMLLELLIKLQKDVDYMKSVCKRLEKELPDEKEDSK